MTRTPKDAIFGNGFATIFRDYQAVAEAFGI
jgi:hypothetical protein